jgi:hypothetical protein
MAGAEQMPIVRTMIIQNLIEIDLIETFIRLLADTGKKLIRRKKLKNKKVNARNA